MCLLCIPVKNLTDNGFKKGAGTAWFHPPDDNAHHIHVEAASGGCPGLDDRRILAVSIKTPGVNHGQNLTQSQAGPNAGKYELSTPDIKWGAGEAGFKRALRDAGIGH
jgi:hypothetical protein